MDIAFKVKHLRGISPAIGEEQQVIANALGLRLNKYLAETSAGTAAGYRQLYDIACLPKPYTLRERKVYLCDCPCECGECVMSTACCTSDEHELLVEFREPTAGHLHTADRNQLKFLDEVLIIDRATFDEWSFNDMHTAELAVNEYLQGDFLASLQ